MYVANHIVGWDELTFGTLNTSVTTVNVANHLYVRNKPYR